MSLGQRRVKTGPVLEINEIAGILCYTIVISEKKVIKKNNINVVIIDQRSEGQIAVSLN